MAPSKAPDSWDDEDSDSTPPSSPVAAPVVARRSKFDDEEDDDDVLEDWEEAEDSEVEREKAKKAAEAKAKADAEAKANHKSKSQRIEEKRQEAMRRKQADMLDDDSEEEVDEAELRRRHREQEKAADLQNAEALFEDVGAIGVPAKRGDKPVTVTDGDDPTKAIDLSSLKLFSPSTVPQFVKMRDTLVPLIGANGKKPQYASFMAEFTKQLCRDLSSEQTKKIASALSTMSNEKMKDEKAAEKGGKKTKAAKTKSSLAASRDVSSRPDTMAYDDGLGDDDFM